MRKAKHRFRHGLMILLSVCLMLPTSMLGIHPAHAADPPPKSGDIIQHYDFDDGVQGWTARGTGEVQSVTNHVYRGAGSILSTGRAGTWNGPSVDVLHLLEKDAVYEITAYVKLAESEDQGEPITIAGIKMSVVQKLIKDDSEQYPNVTPDFVPAIANEWTELRGTFSFDEDVQSQSLYIESDHPTVEFYVDEVTIRLLQPAPETDDEFEPEEILNHGFEDGTTQGWGPKGSVAVEAVTEDAHTGDYSLRTTGRTNNWNGPNLNLLGVLEPGATYEITGYVKLVAGQPPSNLKFTMESLPIGDTDPTHDQINTPLEVTDEQWVNLSGRYSFDRPVSRLEMYLESDDPESAYYLDEVTITLVAPAPPVEPPPALDHFVYDFEENGTQGWGPRGAAKVEIADGINHDDSHDGTKSLAVTEREANWQGAAIDLKSVLKKDAVYQISAYVKLMAPPATESEVKLSIERQFAEEGTGYDTVASDQISDTEWHLLQGSYTFEKDAEILQLYVESSNVTDEFYLDYVVIEMTQAPPLDQSGVKYDFEDGQIGDWFGRFSEETIVVTDEAAYSGNYSLLTTAPTGNRGPMLDVLDIMHVGSTYTISVWVKMAEGEEDTRMNLTIQRGDSNYTWLDGNKTVTANEWVRFSGDYTVASAADILRIFIETHGDVTEPRAFYIDDFEIVYKEPRSIQLDIPSLKDVFAEYFEIGAAIEPQHTAGAHDQLLQKHYNVVVAENVMKPGSVSPSEGQWRWTEPDRLLEYAAQHGMKVRYHTLLWHSQSAEWMYEDEDGNPMVEETDPVKREANKQLLMQRMRDYITEVVTHLKTKEAELTEAYELDYKLIDSYDVVNEVIADGGGMRIADSAWYQIIESDEFIREAFRLTRQLDPEAKLFINDYNTHSIAKRDTLYEKVKEWLADGVPIDGVGHQTHINYRNPSVDSIIESIRMFGDLKNEETGRYLDNQLTELDINIYSDDVEAFLAYEDIPYERHLEVAYRYKELFDGLKALVEQGQAEGKDYISQVIFWGIADDHTWLHNRGTTRQSAPFVFDNELQAKDAYWALVDPSKLPPMARKLNAAKGTPAIDGIVENVWDAVNPQDIVGANLDGQFKVLWDENHLYILAAIHDPDEHEEDLLEVFIEQQDNLHVYPLSRSGQSMEGVSYHVSEFDGGYLIEASIELSSELEVEDQLSFDLRATNADNDAQASWSSRVHQQETGDLGELTLIEIRISEAIRGTPNIDAEWDGLWQDAEEIETKIWVEGSDGATAKVRMMWDSVYLYVYAVVTDDHLSIASPNEWEQDSIEIFIDQNNAKTSTYQTDDGQYRVNYANEQSFGGSATADHFTTATKIVDGGYIVEARIKLDQIEPVAGTLIGFDFQVNDDQNDDGIRDSVAIWNDPTGQSYQNTSRFGVLRFVERTTSPGPSPGPGIIFPPSEQVDLADGKLTITTRPDANGFARVRLTLSDIRNAIAEAIHNHLLIEVQAESGTLAGATLDLPLQDLIGNENIETMTIQVGGASVTLSTVEAAGLLRSGSQTLTLTITEVDPDTLPTNVRDVVHGYPVYDFSLFIDGEPINQFNKDAIQVAMDYTLMPGEKSHQIIVYYIDSDGSLTVVKNGQYQPSSGTIIFYPQHFSIYGAAFAKIEFTDMQQAGWAEHIVETLASRAIVQGVGEARFEPNRAITRAEFAQLLINALDLNQPDAESSFTDVASNAWYSEAIASAEALGIIQGYGDGTFRLHQSISREEMAAMVHRAASIADRLPSAIHEQAAFNDASDISDYALEAVNVLQQGNIINGYPDGTFKPKGIASRAEASSMLYQLLGYE